MGREAAGGYLSAHIRTGVRSRDRGRICYNKGTNPPQDIKLREALRSKRVAVAVGVAALFILGLAFNTWFAVLNRTGFGVDYKPFYAGSHLAGTGHAYDMDALQKAGAAGGVSSRLPVVIYGHKILSGLPYGEAHSIWMAGTVVALVAFAAFWPGTRRLLMGMALVWSIPAALMLLYGQDSPIWLMFFTAALLLIERKRPWSAGVVFSLCICKFHLSLGIPILLAAQKRWKTMIAGTIGTVVWIGACFLIEGPQWPLRYWEMSKIGVFNPAAGRMPTLHGIASWLPWTVVTETVLAGALVLILWVTLRHTHDLGTAGAAAIAGGLLLSPHAYANELVLLIPLAVLTFQRPNVPSWLKGWAVLLLSPAPVLLLVTPEPWLGQVFIAAFAVTAIIALKPNPLSEATAGDAQGAT